MQVELAGAQRVPDLVDQLALAGGGERVAHARGQRQRGAVDRAEQREAREDDGERGHVDPLVGDQQSEGGDRGGERGGVGADRAGA